MLSEVTAAWTTTSAGGLSVIYQYGVANTSFSAIPEISAQLPDSNQGWFNTTEKEITLDKLE